jgi:hypothetical protein
MALCKVYGTIQSGDGTPTVGIYVHAVPVAIPTVIGGVALSPSYIETITTSTGYFEFNLLQGVEFVIIINTLGFKQTILVPPQSEVVLWGLTSIQQINVINTSTGTLTSTGVPIDLTNW